MTELSETCDFQPTDIVARSSSVTAAITLAEPYLCVYGFSRTEQNTAPLVLRGSLVIRVLKPAKFKHIKLDFKGISRTEWPEGIPPKKFDTFESLELFHHEWSFFSASQPGAELGSGAHSVKPLENNFAQSKGPLLPFIGQSQGQDDRGRNRHRSDLLHGLRTVSPSSASPFRLSNLVGGSSPAPTPKSQLDAVHKGYRVFMPAQYIYNFELMLPEDIQESARCNFGSVRHLLSLNIDRQGTFRTQLTGQREVTILRALSLENLEIVEPILISRDWEQQLLYNIAISGKAFVIGSEFSIAFSFIPLAKVRLHRLRVYITEHTEYWCSERRVHRVEPTHKFLLMNKVSPEGITGNLLDLASSDQFELLSKIKVPTSFPNRRDYLRPNIRTPHIKVHHWIKVVLRLSRPDSTTASGKPNCYEVSIDSPVTLVDQRTRVSRQLPAYTSRTPSVSNINNVNGGAAFLNYSEYVESRSPPTASPAQVSASSSGVESGPVFNSRYFSSPSPNVGDPANQPPENLLPMLRRMSTAPPPFEQDSETTQPPDYDVLQEDMRSYRRRFEEYERQLGFDASSTNGTDERSSPASDETGHETTSSMSPRNHLSEIIWQEDAEEPEPELEPAETQAAETQAEPEHTLDTNRDIFNDSFLQAIAHEDDNALNPLEVRSTLSNESAPRLLRQDPTDPTDPPIIGSASPVSPISTYTVPETPGSPGVAEVTEKLHAYQVTPSPQRANLSHELSASRRPQKNLASSPFVSRPPQSSRSSSVSSTRGRYYRQSSMVSVDLADQRSYRGTLDRGSPRYNVRVSNPAEVPHWYATNPGTSQISVNEYRRADRDGSGGDIGLRNDYEDEVDSVRSRSHSVFS